MPNPNIIRRVVLGGVAPFVPNAAILALSPLVWWKPDLSQVTKSSNRLSQVNDISGNNNHLIQTTETNKALWVDNVINGKPVIRFDDTDIFFDFTSALSPTTVTIYLVYKPDAEITPSIGVQVVFNESAGGTTRGVVSFGPVISQLTDETFSVLGIDGGLLKGVASTNNISAAFHNFMFSLIGTTEVIEIDGVDQTLIVSTDGGLDAATNNRFINVDLLGSTSAPPDGDIAEIIIFSTAHNDATRTIVENYFNAEFGI